VRDDIHLEMPNTDNNASVPILENWRQGTRSDIAATVFCTILLIGAVTALNATLQTASRLTWSFARDNAIFGSRWLGKIDSKQQTPIAALVFNSAVIFIIGCIYLGSTSAFNAFIGTGLILQHITYAFPAVLLMMKGRSRTWLPESRSFRVPPILGWVANATTVWFAVVVLIFYDFPTALPVTGSNMSKFYDQSCCVFANRYRLCECGYCCHGAFHSYQLVWTC
jgi:choline transport protein